MDMLRSMDMANRIVGTGKGIVVCAFIVYLGAFVGCQVDDGGPEKRAMDPKHGAKTQGLQNWIAQLHREYESGGIQAFLTSRDELRAIAVRFRSDPEYDVPAMVLGLSGTPVIEKEADLAAELRSLAVEIEKRPGRSAAEWRTLRDKVFSYSYGNGPEDATGVPAQLVRLYQRIAGANWENRK